MSFGGGIPPAGPGGVYNYQGEPWSGDPRISPGLSRAIGWRVREPDGSAAYDKFGAGDEDWVPVGTASVVGGVDSINGLVGVLALATIVPGQNVTQPDASTILISGGGQTRVANLTALAALNASTFPIGNTWAWVVTLGRWFQLQTSALPTGINAVTANSLAGAQWLATNWLNPVWQAQTAWSVNTATGNDENAGTSGAPLLTVSEVARRLSFAQITGSLAIAVVGNMASTDQPYFTFAVKGGFVSIAGTPTTIYSGTITTYTAPTPAPATDDPELKDTGITGGSFTAAGALANGVIGSTTSGAPRSFYVAKDLGTTTARTSMPYTGSGDGTLTNGQTYVLQQMSTGRQMRFTETVPFVVQISNFFFAGGDWFDPCVFFETCWFASANELGPRAFIQCGFQACTVTGTSPNGDGLVINSGMIRGTGTSSFTLFGVAVAQTNFTTTWQGIGLVCDTADITIQGDVRMYDCTKGVGGGPLVSTYWSQINQTGGAFAGSGNTQLAFANKLSVIAHVANPYWLAGSATNVATPIFASPGPGITVASESAGGAQMNTQQNGIFPTS